MFELAVEAEFCAAHSLRGYAGKCANVHGHNFKVQAVVRGDALNAVGMVADFGDLKRILRGVCEELDHQNLNDLAPFREVNPTVENIARHIYGEVKSKLAQTPEASLSQLFMIRVWERDLQYAAYWEE